MSATPQETPVTIQPYGRGGYFNGCVYREAAAIFELPHDITERFINVLGARDEAGEVNTPILYEKILPIGRAVGESLRERLVDEQDIPLCRKTKFKNCGIDPGLGFSSIVFKPEEGQLEPYINTHMGCGIALIEAVDSNTAAAAPVEAENASPGLQFEMGCYTQIEAAAELAGQMMLDKLLELEAEA